MTITREKKEIRITEIQKMLEKGKVGTLVFVSFNGVIAKDMATMHSVCFSKNVDFKVIKKTLLRKASEMYDGENVDTSLLKGEIAVFVNDEPLVASSTVASFKVDKPATFTIVGGIHEGEYMDSERMQEIASIPDRDVLYGRLLSMLQTPVRQYVVILEQLANIK